MPDLVGLRSFIITTSKDVFSFSFEKNIEDFVKGVPILFEILANNHTTTFFLALCGCELERF